MKKDWVKSPEKLCESALSNLIHFSRWLFPAFPRSRDRIMTLVAPKTRQILDPRVTNNFLSIRRKKGKLDRNGMFWILYSILPHFASLSVSIFFGCETNLWIQNMIIVGFDTNYYVLEVFREIRAFDGHSLRDATEKQEIFLCTRLLCNFSTRLNKRAIGKYLYLQSSSNISMYNYESSYFRKDIKRPDLELPGGSVGSSVWAEVCFFAEGSRQLQLSLPSPPNLELPRKLDPSQAFLPGFHQVRLFLHLAVPPPGHHQPALRHPNWDVHGSCAMWHWIG